MKCHIHEAFSFDWIPLINDMYCTCPAHALLTLRLNNGRNPMQQLTICAQSKWLKLKHLSGK